MTDLFLLLAGFILLIVSGEFLVRGAVSIAKSLGMSSLLIGITLVGFGTSSPELVTSLQASFAGSPGIAIGNFVGSNISNILLIVGTAAIIFPLAVSRRSLDRDGMVVLASAVMFAGIAFLLPYNQIVGAVFVTGLLAYLVTAYQLEMRHTRASKSASYTVPYKEARPEADLLKVDASDHTAAFEKAQAHEELGGYGSSEPSESEADDYEEVKPWLAVVFALGGLVGIILGGRLLVDGAVGIARTYGVSEAVIGLTIVAVGTSMPELVTSVIAALRKHSDVAVGNVLGSNIYNTLGIGGRVALIAPTEIPEQIIRYDNIVMIVATTALLLFAYSRGRIGRIEGALFLAAYVTYIYSLWPTLPVA